MVGGRVVISGVDLSAKPMDFGTWLQVIAAYIPLGLGAFVGFLRLYRRSVVMSHRVSNVEANLSLIHEDLDEMSNNLTEVKEKLGAVEGKIDTVLVLMNK
jgi:hypothetical protein